MLNNDLKKKTLMSLEEKIFIIQNEVEDNMNHINRQYLSMVVGVVRDYCQFEAEVQAYENVVENVLSKTEDYISLLGISKPIRVERDENGKPIYKKLNDI